jgi:outer membrane protein assembly factor BamD
MEDFDAHNWLEAQARLREVKRKYAYSKYARMAELRIADADFAQERYAEAIRGLQQYVHDPPLRRGGGVVRALEICGGAVYREIRRRAAPPSADERDQGSVAAAYRELRATSATTRV